MRGLRSFSHPLAAVDLRKIKAQIDKPFYDGFTVLEQPKLHMYKFHYHYMRARFGDKAKLLFTDSDSLMYSFQEIDPFDVFLKDRAEYFYFASYPQSHKCYDPLNNKVIGKFKDEANGEQIIEFVGLRPKMYSYLLKKHLTTTLFEKHKAKGIQYAITAKLKHEDYLKQLEAPHENRLTNRRIGSKLHQIYSIEFEKSGLCALDDKRILLDDGISTLAYAHYKVTGYVVDIEAEPAPRTRQRAVSFSQEISLGEDLRNAMDCRYNARATQSCPLRLGDTAGFQELNDTPAADTLNDFPSDLFSLGE